MSSDELVQLTGYAAKTFSSVYPASHPLIARTNGMLTLADGVWTDHAWLAETVRRAANAVRDDHHADAAEWLRYSLELAGQIDGAPYERLPRSRRIGGPGPRLDHWSWTDDFPYTVSARAHAGQEAVEAVLAAAELWLVAGQRRRAPFCTHGRTALQIGPDPSARAGHPQRATQPMAVRRTVPATRCP